MNSGIFRIGININATGLLAAVTSVKITGFSGFFVF